MIVNENKIVFIKKRKKLGTNNLVSPAAACVTGQTEANAVVIDAASRPQFPYKKHEFLEAPPSASECSNATALRAPLRLLT